MRSVDYSPDLTPPWKRKKQLPEVPADLDLVVEETGSGYCGAIVRVEKVGGMHVVVLEDRHGRTRSFQLGAGFLLEGEPVRLVPPSRTPSAPAGPRRTASGSIAVEGARARVARAGRMYVEGKHDAELVEKVWGDDLRVEGVVVEMLDGVDDLPGVVAEFQPGPGRRLGVLVDHLVSGSKESRIAAEVARGPWGQHVLVVGHPFVDVWQGVRPAALGIEAWPVVPRGLPWKEGILAGLGWAHSSQADVAAGWRRILAAVHGWTDLEPELLGRVEELVDFVTGDPRDS
ncbi:MAG: DUF3097 domain-containing protein [Actinomycetales bacterium]